MALYWPEARLAVSCAGAAAPREDLPDDVLVIHVGTDEALDPNFAEEVSYLLCERLEDWKESLVDEVRARGSKVIEPQGSHRNVESEGDLSDAEQAERRLEERILAIMGHLESTHEECDATKEGPEDEDCCDEDIWAGFGESFEERGGLYGPYGYGLLGSSGINIVINHCDELFVRR